VTVRRAPALVPSGGRIGESLMPTLSTLAVLFAMFAPQQGDSKPPEPAPTRVELPPNETIRIHGTAVAVDEAGTEHAHEDGLLRLAQWPTGLFEVPVRDGKFEATVVAGAKLLMPRLQLSNRTVELQHEEVVANAHGSIDLRGPWGGDLDLKVVDAATHAELSDCEWIHDPSFQILVDLDGRRSFAGESANHVASPLKLAQAGRYWVRAPGHAWQLFVFEGGDAGSHGEATLALPKACTLDVVLPEAKTKEREWLVVDALPDEGATSNGNASASPSSSGKRPLRWYVRRGASGAIRLESLPPGRLLARTILDYEMHPWFPNEIPFASATVEIAPDRENRLVITGGAIPAGLHEDGTVDRTGVLTFAGSKPDAARPKSGILKAGFGVRDPVQRDGEVPRGAGPTYRITRDDFPSSSSPPLEVVDGKVRLRCPYGCLLWIDKVTLDGVEFPLNGRDVVADTTTEPFTIEIPDLESLGGPPTIVHVVDKVTHAELQHVSIVPYSFHQQFPLTSFTGHPGSLPTESLLIADGTSPIRLRDATGRWSQSRLFVRAAGYAWTTFRHDWTKPGERTVELERACDLSITLEPSIDATGLFIAVFRLKDRNVAIRENREFLAQSLDERVSLGPDREEVVSKARSDLAELESPDFGAALIRESGMPYAVEAPARSGATRIEGVPLGRLGVALCNRRAIQSPIGFTLVEATAGGEIPVSIRVPPNAMRAVVPLAGTATIPAEWRATKALLRVMPVGTLASSLQPTLVRGLTPVEPDDPKGEAFTWDAGAVLPGTYRLRIEMDGTMPRDACYGCRITVGESGETNARIDVPKPCDVEIVLVDDATNAPVTVEGVHWQPADDAESYELGSTFIRSEIGKDGSLKFRCPAERIQLWIHDSKIGDRREILDLAPPNYHRTIRLARHGGIHLRWMRGTQSVKPDRFFFSTLYSIAADGSATEVDLDDEMSEWIPVPKPGRYRVEIGIEVDDDEKEDESVGIAPIDVTVPSDSFVDVDVQLPEPRKKKDG
jgi:hypothetical protein